MARDFSKEISFSKYRRLERDLRDALALVGKMRKEGLLACKADPGGGTWDRRGMAIDCYVGARRWVCHYRKLLASSIRVKGATRHYAGRA